MIFQVVSNLSTNRPDPDLQRTQARIACLPGYFVKGDQDMLPQGLQ